MKTTTRSQTRVFDDLRLQTVFNPTNPIAFSTVTAFEARCKSATAPECRRASGWQVRWPADQALRVERAVPANQVEPTIIAERPLGVSFGTVFQQNTTQQTIHTP